MRSVSVCIGSACHLKGSYKVIETFKRVIEDEKIGKDVELKAAFCMGECAQSVAVRFDDGNVVSVSPDESERIFREHIFGVAKNELH